MKEIIEKIGSYNLFNYLLPGVLYVVVVSRITSYNLLSDKLIIDVFIYYFIGMSISRIGSLFVEEPLKKIGFLKFKPYKDYIRASSKDNKINILLEQSNTYRSLTAMVLMVFITKGYELMETKFAFLLEAKIWIIFLLLLGIFLAGYRKKTKFITSRIDQNPV